jgi:hypothetical protein
MSWLSASLGAEDAPGQLGAQDDGYDEAEAEDYSQLQVLQKALLDKEGERERVLLLFRRGKASLTEVERQLADIDKEAGTLRDQIKAYKSRVAIAQAWEGRVMETEFVKVTMLLTSWAWATFSSAVSPAAPLPLSSSPVVRICTIRKRRPSLFKKTGASSPGRAKHENTLPRGRHYNRDAALKKEGGRVGKVPGHLVVRREDGTIIRVVVASIPCPTRKSTRPNQGRADAQFIMLMQELTPKPGGTVR